VYADLDEEAKARQEQERADAIAANPLDIPDDESVDGPPGEFKASLQCTFPSMEPSADIEAKRDAGDCTLTLVVSVAPNGVDFVGACKIPAFSPTFDGVEPAAGCLTDSRTYALRGKGFEKMAGTKAKFSAGGKTWTSNVKFVDSTTMTFSLPKNMKLPPVEEPVEGSEDEETKLRYPSFGVGMYVTLRWFVARSTQPQTLICCVQFRGGASTWQGYDLWKAGRVYRLQYAVWNVEKCYSRMQV